MGVLLVHHVLVDVGGRTCLLDEVAPAAAAPFAGSAGVGAVVAAAQDVREELLVDLGAGLDEVAVGCAKSAPAVGALDRAHPARADLAAVVEERLAGAWIVVAPHLPRAAELVALRATAVGQDLAHRDGDRIADFDAGVVRTAGNRLALSRIQAAALGHAQVDAVEEAF